MIVGYARMWRSWSVPICRCERVCRAMELEFARYPGLYKAWRDAIAYVIARQREMGNPMFLAGKEVESVEDVLG